jgi:hypothetical protein
MTDDEAPVVGLRAAPAIVIPDTPTVIPCGAKRREGDLALLRCGMDPVPPPPEQVRRLGAAGRDACGLPRVTGPRGIYGFDRKAANR